MVVLFKTLPDESSSSLQALGNLMHRVLRTRGYTVTVEPWLHDLPGTAQLVGKRNHRTHYVLIRQHANVSEVELWVRYAQSCSTDTRVTFLCANQKKLGVAAFAKHRKSGIGIAVAMGSEIEFLLESKDLAFHAKAPTRSSLKPKVRKKLGDAMDKLDAGEWREAFEDACTSLEEECLVYLIKNQKLNRVKYMDGSSLKQPTIAEIKKMSLGGLKKIFCNMVSQNQLESNLCAALTKLNPDRILKVHYPKKKSTEAALRKHAGTHFWLISNALTWLC
jgi:hypothetical protein